MVMKQFLYACLLGLCANAVWANEHPACYKIHYTYQNHSIDEIRSIAASCKWPPMANLYHNRAYNIELQNKAQAISGLIQYDPSYNQNNHYLSYKLYIQMVEQFSSIWYPDPEQRVNFLLSEYDRINEITELRIKGLDFHADRLEQQARTKSKTNTVR